MGGEEILTSDFTHQYDEIPGTHHGFNREELTKAAFLPPGQDDQLGHHYNILNQPDQDLENQAELVHEGSLSDPTSLFHLDRGMDRAWFAGIGGENTHSRIENLFDVDIPVADARVFEGKYEGIVSATDVDGNDTDTSNNPQDVIVDGMRPFLYGFLFNIDDSSFGYAFEETSNGLEMIGNLNQDHPFLSRVNKQGPDEPVEIFLGIPPIPTTFDFSLTYVKANPNTKTNLTVDDTLLIEDGKEKEIINDNSISGIELSRNTRPGPPDNNNQPGIFDRPDIVVANVRDEDGDILGISNQGAEAIDQDQLPRVFKLSGKDQANTPTDGTPSTLGIRNP